MLGFRVGGGSPSVGYSVSYFVTRFRDLHLGDLTGGDGGSVGLMEAQSPQLNAVQ